MSKKTKTNIPPSLQPRKKIKKAIPKAESTKPKESRLVVQKVAKVAQNEKKAAQKLNKERFTLWLSEDIYKAFKVHVATRKGSASDYIENLIRKDLRLK